MRLGQTDGAAPIDLDIPGASIRRLDGWSLGAGQLLLQLRIVQQLV